MACFFSRFFDLIFPRFCVQCERLNFFLCPDCQAQIEFFSLPLERKLEPCWLDELWAMAEYAEPLASLIKTMKYQSVKAVGAELGRLLYQHCSLPQAELVTAVPLHPKKQQLRGFNQAEEIALALAARAGLPYQTLLQRTQHAAAQASVHDKSQRLIRLKNHFQLATGVEHKKLANCRILIIDDVVTTGATLNECAAVLKQTGASRVVGLAVAHEG